MSDEPRPSFDPQSTRVTVEYASLQHTHREFTELPLRILVMGDFTMQPDPRVLEDRKPINVDRDNFGKVMAEQKLAPSFSVKDTLSGSGGELSVSLKLRRLSDMEPAAIAEQVPALKEMLDRRVTLVSNPGLDESGRAEIADIDGRLSRQIDEILHHPTFMELEAAWRGLQLLVSRTPFRENVRIAILNCSREDLLVDFEDMLAIEKSGLWRILHGALDEGGFPSGDNRPFGAILANYDFGASPADVELLYHCARVAASAFAPFFAAASPRLFGLSRLADLPSIPDLGAQFEKVAYTKFLYFREKEQARYAGLLLPRILLRLPYGKSTAPVAAFDYEEEVRGERDGRCWGNPIFALGARMTETFGRYRHCLDLAGLGADGGLSQLPAYRYEDAGEARTQPPIEIELPGKMAADLAKVGLVTLRFREDRGDVYLASASCLQTPAPFEAGQGAEALGRALGSRIPWLLFACRFAHYLAVLHREQSWSHYHDSKPWKPADAERVLQAWLERHVSSADVVSPEQYGKRPLKSAAVRVTEIEDQPGYYGLELKLSPHVEPGGAEFTLAVTGKLQRVEDT